MGDRTLNGRIVDSPRWCYACIISGDVTTPEGRQTHWRLRAEHIALAGMYIGCAAEKLSLCQKHASMMGGVAEKMGAVLAAADDGGEERHGDR